MSKRFLSSPCSATTDAVLVSAFVDYIDGRDEWVTDEHGNSRPAAERSLGICSLCGAVLKTHFVILHSGKTTDIGPTHPKYAAIREAFCSEGGAVRAPGSDVPVIAPRYFCPEALRYVGKMPVRPASYEGQRAALLSASDMADHKRSLREREARRNFKRETSSRI